MTAPHTTAAPANSLGQQLRRLRRERKLTLEQLAAASDVSRSMISKIERGESHPTTPVVGRLAEALKVGISTLVGPYPGKRRNAGAAATLVRAGSQPVYRDPETGFIRRSLSPADSGRRIEVARNELPPRGQSGTFVAHEANVEEHVIVTRGRLRVTLGDQAYLLTEGDVLWFLAGVSHQFENTGRGRCEYIIVIDRGQRP